MPATHQALPDQRNAEVLISINDELFPRDEAKISVFDSGFVVGDGVWEGIRYTNGSYPHLDRHLNRLFAGAEQIGLDIGKTREEIVEAMDRVIAANGMESGVHVRLMVTRGVKKTPAQHPDLVISGPTIVIIAEHKAADPNITADGIALVTSAVRRPPPDTLDQRLNCHSKLHEVVALLEALESGGDEALMLDTNGHVATCNSTNFFIVRDGAVWTSSGLHCLNGITRGLVLELARANGVEALELDFTLDQVHSADEAFVTGTFGGITPVITIDGITIGDGEMGPVTSRLLDVYRAAVQ